MRSPRTAAATFLALAYPSLLAQVTITPRTKPGATDDSRKPSLRIDTSLVLVPVTVTDALNRPVTGLEKENFRVFDENTEQTITHFAMEDDPVAVGFVFDSSGSMAAGLGEARRAAQEFFDTGESGDEYFLVEFDTRARLVVPLTRNSSEIKNQILHSRSGGSTALLDAVYLALNEIRKSRKTKKAIVIISDGGENSSRYTAGEVKNVLRETEALIYSVAVGCEWQNGCYLLDRIAKQTGGLLFHANTAGYTDIARKIIIDLRNRYVLGYVPGDQQADGRYHRIRVQLVLPRGLPPTIRARWRLGYYAPD